MLINVKRPLGRLMRATLKEKRGCQKGLYRKSWNKKEAARKAYTENPEKKRG